MNYNQFPTNPDGISPMQDFIYIRTAQLMTTFRNKRGTESNLSSGCTNKTLDTVQVIVNSDCFNGYALHSKYYKNGVNSDTETGYHESLCIGGKYKEQLVGFLATTQVEPSGADQSTVNSVYELCFDDAFYALAAINAIQEALASNGINAAEKKGPYHQCYEAPKTSS